MHPRFWQPDSASEECTLCRRPFSLFLRRRHHCRACGRLFCFECASRFVWLHLRNVPLTAAGTDAPVSGSPARATQHDGGGSAPRWLIDEEFIRMNPVYREWAGPPSGGSGAGGDSTSYVFWCRVCDPCRAHMEEQTTSIRGGDASVNGSPRAGQPPSRATDPQPTCVLSSRGAAEDPTVFPSPHSATEIYVGSRDGRSHAPSTASTTALSRKEHHRVSSLEQPPTSSKTSNRTSAASLQSNPDRLLTAAPAKAHSGGTKRSSRDHSAAAASVPDTFRLAFIFIDERDEAPCADAVYHACGGGGGSVTNAHSTSSTGAGAAQPETGRDGLTPTSRQPSTASNSNCNSAALTPRQSPYWYRPAAPGLSAQQQQQQQPQPHKSCSTGGGDNNNNTAGAAAASDRPRSSSSRNASRERHRVSPLLLSPASQQASAAAQARARVGSGSGAFANSGNNNNNTSNNLASSSMNGSGSFALSSGNPPQQQTAAFPAANAGGGGASPLFQRRFSSYISSLSSPPRPGGGGAGAAGGGFSTSAPSMWGAATAAEGEDMFSFASRLRQPSTESVASGHHHHAFCFSRHGDSGDGQRRRWADYDAIVQMVTAELEAGGGAAAPEDARGLSSSAATSRPASDLVGVTAPPCNRSGSSHSAHNASAASRPLGDDHKHRCHLQVLVPRELSKGAGCIGGNTANCYAGKAAEVRKSVSLEITCAALDRSLSPARAGPSSSSSSSPSALRDGRQQRKRRAEEPSGGLLRGVLRGRLGGFASSSPADASAAIRELGYGSLGGGADDGLRGADSDGSAFNRAVSALVAKLSMQVDGFVFIVQRRGGSSAGGGEEGGKSLTKDAQRAPQQHRGDGAFSPFDDAAAREAAQRQQQYVRSAFSARSARKIVEELRLYESGASATPVAFVDLYQDSEAEGEEGAQAGDADGHTQHRPHVPSSSGVRFAHASTTEQIFARMRPLHAYMSPVKRNSGVSLASALRHRRAAADAPLVYVTNFDPRQRSSHHSASSHADPSSSPTRSASIHSGSERATRQRQQQALYVSHAVAQLVASRVRRDDFP